MTRRKSGAVKPAVLTLLASVLSLSVCALGGAPVAPQPVSEAGVPVMYRGQEILRIHRGIGSLGPTERARLTSERLNQLVRDSGFDPSSVVVRDSETYSELVHGDRVLGVITEEDAKAVGRPRPEYARQIRDRLTAVVAATREEFSPSAIVSGLAWTALATALLGVSLWLLVHVRHRVQARVAARFRRLLDPRADAGATLSTTRLGALIHGTINAVSAATAIACGAVWVQVALDVLPWSRPLARSIYRYGAAPLRTLWLGFQSVVPNLFYLAVIALVTFAVLRIVRIVFKEIEAGTLRIPSFPDDWAEPTYKLVRTLLLAVAIVGSFPYIPGAQSPAFQGISLFLGLLVSLSSSSALSNIIAGIILTYTRAFKLGDIVRIGETLGEVTIKRLLVTHVRTYKNVVVSIPNSVVLTTQVLNYTTLAAERGLVLHTSVTIGYDAPWRRVHELLIAAAARTEGVLEEPRPYVLQRALNDFSVEYEINASVASALPMPDTYSALHANIQECFNEAGVEIVSPNYLALRDGNPVTTPRQYLPADYAAPAFRLRQVEREALSSESAPR